MLWRKGRRSDNVIDARGRRFARGGGLGIGGILVVLVISWVFGIDPRQMLGLVDSVSNGAGAQAPAATQPPPQNDPQAEFIQRILGSTEDTWSSVFRGGGQQYVAPKLVLFSGSIASACGMASSATGPFYCPGDQRVYLDTAFFAEMQSRFHAAGDFARAYVIAHEVGHHVQNQLGVFDAVQEARQRGAPMQGADGLSVRQELQADCFAGVWAQHAQQRLHWLQDGDVDEALNAAAAVGDDRLQKQTRGHVVPDSFTHGTSAQRVHWFKTGMDSGDLSRCDTFSATL